MISAGVFEILAQIIPKQPTRNEAKKVAIANVSILKNSINVKRKPCPIAASAAESNKVLKGGEQLYANAKPASAAKNISISTENIIVKA